MKRAAMVTTSRAPRAVAWIAFMCSLGIASGTGAAQSRTALAASAPEAERPGAASAEQRIVDVSTARLTADVFALSIHRPSYPFWRHIFAIADGSVAYGSATDGRLLAVFRQAGDWAGNGRWEEPTLAGVLDGMPLGRGLDQRREQVAQLLERSAGPVVHNPTRGQFLRPNVARYGMFLDEWSAIYERFGVPAELGLAQAVVESGLSGTVRSEARAIGFCQWLQTNWNHLKKLSPHVIEAQNQTSQAPYCAAYLTILATRYGSYVPALSEHHAGGTNVGRILINGVRLGGDVIQEQYFRGSAFALAARNVEDRSYSELYRTYGPRSFRYTELVFGNMSTIAELRVVTPQQPIHAMRTTRNLPLTELTRRTGLSVAELKRYNPALKQQVPARSTVYLPKRIAALGADVAFWHRPADPEFAAALADFLELSVPAAEWDDPAFVPVLRTFQKRFARTQSEEGTVMATVLAYVADDVVNSQRAAILAAYRTSPRITELFDRAVLATTAQQLPQQ